MTIYVTSDLHFSHENILKHQPNRKFDSIEEMNEGIVEEWNSVATSKDTIYILGDVAFLGSNFITATLLARLNGTIKVVPGNHDYDLWKVQNYFKVLRHDKVTKKDTFEILPPIFELKYRKHKIVMCHYPMESWNGSCREIRSELNGVKKSSIMLHGHNHGKNTPCPFRMDVGMDATGRVLTPLDNIIDSFYPSKLK
tara:strand:- start:5435 stop:6025 length:591 start_codon:yes stop_codon:yes gene_type:complete